MRAGLDIECPQRQRHRVCPVRDADGVIQAQLTAELPLERRDFGPQNIPTTVNDALQRLDHLTAMLTVEGSGVGLADGRYGHDVRGTPADGGGSSRWIGSIHS